jgi:DNA-binding LacI/PurR family transcriptional regulator
MEETTGRATIWQVAARAGVSHQTVSRFVNGDPRMRPETRARVSASIRELGYRPNLSARSMRTRRSQRIAVVLPPMIHQGLAMALGGAVLAANEQGYAVQVVSESGGPQERADRVRDIADSGEVDGVLALVPLPPESQGSYPPRAALVIADDYDEGSRSIGELADATPIAEIIEHLADLGHRRFLHITGELRFFSARERRRVFVETIERLGLGPARVHEGAWTAQAGRGAIAALDGRERERPTAIVTACDPTAAGVLEAAAERGWAVPADISVTGWDNHVLGANMRPALTTVDTDHRQLGRNLMHRLTAALRHEDPPEDEAPLNEILWRGSTGPAPE